jgi:hypothetical protein
MKNALSINGNAYFLALLGTVLLVIGNKMGDQSTAQIGKGILLCALTVLSPRNLPPST